MHLFRLRNCLFLFVVLASLASPFSADNANAGPKSIDLASFGTGFYCSGVGVGGGSLFNTDMADCNPDGTRNLFSYSICMFENIIDDIMGNLYCGMVYALMTPFWAMLILFTAVFGGAVLTGILPVTTTQATLFLFKFALVVVFATDSSFTISILYRGLMYFIQGSVELVMNSAFDNLGGISDTGPDSILGKMDGLLGQFLARNTSTPDANDPCAAHLMAMMITFIAAVPMVSGMILATGIQFLMVFFRTVLGYLVSITGIMFLLTLSPIFLSLALFKTTQNFFVMWLQALISFAIQIFIVFAMIGIVLSLDIGKQLDNLYQIAVPHKQAVVKYPARYFYDNLCTVCDGTLQKETQPSGAVASIYVCTLDANGKKTPIEPQSLTMKGDFFTFLMLTLGKIFFLSYIASMGLEIAPSIARELAGSAIGMKVTDVSRSGENVTYDKDDYVRKTSNATGAAASGSDLGGAARGAGSTFGKLIGKR